MHGNKLPRRHNGYRTVLGEQLTNQRDSIDDNRQSLPPVGVTVTWLCGAHRGRGVSHAFAPAHPLLALKCQRSPTVRMMLGHVTEVGPRFMELCPDTGRKLHMHCCSNGFGPDPLPCGISREAYKIACSEVSMAQP